MCVFFLTELFDGVVLIFQGLVWVVDLVLDGVLEVIFDSFRWFD